MLSSEDGMTPRQRLRFECLKMAHSVAVNRGLTEVTALAKAYEVFVQDAEPKKEPEAESPKAQTKSDPFG